MKKKIWSIKPKCAVPGARSCAELAIVDQLVCDGWGNGLSRIGLAGVWLRNRWFPAGGFRAITEAGAPAWAAHIFDRLRAANGGGPGGFFDVFAWREPDEVRFAEAKVRRRSRQLLQCRFLAAALRFHEPRQSKVIEVRPRP